MSQVCQAASNDPGTVNFINGFEPAKLPLALACQIARGQVHLQTIDDGQKDVHFFPTRLEIDEFQQERRFPPFVSSAPLATEEEATRRLDKALAGGLFLIVGAHMSVGEQGLGGCDQDVLAEIVSSKEGQIIVNVVQGPASLEVGYLAPVVCTMRHDNLPSFIDGRFTTVTRVLIRGRYPREWAFTEGVVTKPLKTGEEADDQPAGAMPFEDGQAAYEPAGEAPMPELAVRVWRQTAGSNFFLSKALQRYTGKVRNVEDPYGDIIGVVGALNSNNVEKRRLAWTRYDRMVSRRKWTGLCLESNNWFI